MQLSSAIGYTAFPLSEAGYANTFQDTMHIVITIIVVVLSIVALILLSIGFIRNGRYKIMGFLAIGTLVLMALGAILSGAVPSILGLMERLSIYSLQIYTVFLSVFLLKYKNLQNSKNDEKVLEK
jgi:predicted membrane channel-forming protein YqfA (hemolysin III family)